MIQATGTPAGDQPPGDQTGPDADAPLDRPAEPDDDTDTDTDDDAVPEHQQPDRYQPL